MRKTGCQRRFRKRNRHREQRRDAIREEAAATRAPELWGLGGLSLSTREHRRNAHLVRLAIRYARHDAAARERIMAITQSALSTTRDLRAQLLHVANVVKMERQNQIDESEARQRKSCR
jgi:hypothetical protein